MTGTLITISSSSWLGIWIGLEINLLSFIPLIIDNKNILYSESAIKYFLVQTMASIIFLFVNILYIIKFNFYFNLENKFNLENFIVINSIIIKLGAAPLHFWFPNIIEGLSWNNTLIILTWQKIAPLIIISTIRISNQIIFFIVTSCIIGSIGGFNQTSLKKVLTYSSINHIRWLITANLINDTLWIFYLTLYFVINYSIIRIFKMFNVTQINQLFLFKNEFSLLKLCFIINFLSLGGLPPFTGFFPKWIVIEALIITKNILLILIIIITTLITLYFYTRLTFSAFLFYYPFFSWNKKINYRKISSIKKNIRINFFITISLIIWCINNFFIVL